ncbi:unnamed protein product [Rotaria sp. Silwood1]|nr:unnamed protein product [Rotaria sp. Silwood1]
MMLTIYYASIARSNFSLTSNRSLSPEEIDAKVKCLKDNIAINASTSFIMSALLHQSNDIVVGAWFKMGVGGNYINDSNVNGILNTNFSAAAIFRASSLINVTYLNLLLIDDPKDYRQLNDSRNGTVVSSVIVANLWYKNNESERTNRSLYFKKNNHSVENTSNNNFVCVYYDTNTSSWDETGCTKPHYNTTFDRYECSCNHSSSFALLWLPPRSRDSGFLAEDIASLVFQSISIVCFLALIIFDIVTRVKYPNVKLKPIDLLPLVSNASTVLLFIFYIALALTVHTITQPSKEDKCFTSATILMFIVYFFLMLMFCTKTSIGYFNYIQFVRLFPPPSFKNLYILLIGSLIFSIIAVLFVIGFNSNPSFHIIYLHANLICWFKRSAIHYFLTIPVCIFLLFNLIILVLIVKRMAYHVRNTTTRHPSYSRMKKCVLILIHSSLSQGIGWLTGPLILVSGNTAGHILSWIFIICNGLEELEA